MTKLIEMPMDGVSKSIQELHNTDLSSKFKFRTPVEYEGKDGNHLKGHKGIITGKDLLLTESGPYAEVTLLNGNSYYFNVRNLKLIN